MKADTATVARGQPRANQLGRSKLPRRKIMNYLRLNELCVLAAFYVDNGVELDPTRWLPAMLHALHGAYGPLDLPAVRDHLLARGFPVNACDDLVLTTIRSVEGAYDPAKPLMAPAVAGEHIGLHKAERRELGIKTMRAVDETPDERRAFVDDSRKARDAVRKRRERAEAGATPRQHSAARTRPWEAAGLSRRTWYRRQKPRHDGTVSSADNLL